MINRAYSRFDMAPRLSANEVSPLSSRLPLLLSLFFLIFPQPSLCSDEPPLVIDESGASFYQFPDASSRKKGQLEPGSRVEVLSITGDWLMVSNADQSKVGWVLSGKTVRLEPKIDTGRSKESPESVGQVSASKGRSSLEESNGDGSPPESSFWIGILLVALGYFICSGSAGWSWLVRLPLGLLLMGTGLLLCFD